MVFVYFILFFLIWLVFSGKFDVFHMSMGVVSSLIVAYSSKDLLKTDVSLIKFSQIVIRFVLYIPWLLFQIIKSNIGVTFIILSPKVIDRIDPTIFTYKTKLKSNLAKVLLANSITLTPGTITISLLNDRLIIHTLKKAGTLDGVRAIEEKLLKVFKEN